MDFKPALENMREEFAEIESKLSDPDVIANQNRFRELSRRHSHLQPLLEAYDAYLKAEAERDDADALLEDTEDPEMREYLQAEKKQADQKLGALHDRIVRMLLPKDPDDKKKAVVEIRSGTGGEEAALFAADLYTMYTRWAEEHGYKTEVMEEAPSDMGGYNKIVFTVAGEKPYGKLRFESGVHRVQRVPETESQGRIHTSAASVVVLPEAEDIDVQIDQSDIIMETFRAGGPGGQHMQKNDTAVRITHEPSGISVSSTNQRSQHQNKERAMDILRSKLYDIERQKRQEEVAEARKSSIKSGDRSEKIRTYNFPQDRVTDHRIGFTTHNLPAVMTGEIDELLDALAEAEYQERLAAAEADAAAIGG